MNIVRVYSTVEPGFHCRVGRRRLVVVGPHQFAVGVEEVDEDPVVLGECRRVGGDREPVRHVDRAADGG